MQHMSGCRLIRVLPRLGPSAKGIQVALLAALVLLMTAPQGLPICPRQGLIADSAGSTIWILPARKKNSSRGKN